MNDDEARPLAAHLFAASLPVLRPFLFEEATGATRLQQDEWAAQHARRCLELAGVFVAVAGERR